MAEANNRFYLDLDDGWDMGLHRAVGHTSSKLLYASCFLAVWLIFGSCVFAVLEDANMHKYDHGSYDYDAMLEVIQNISNSTGPVTVAEDQRLHLDHAVEWMNEHRPAKVKWGFGGGFFFSLLSITTIGYGRYLCPATIGGRLFVIPFTLIGIPVLSVFYTVWAKSALDWLNIKVKEYTTTTSTGGRSTLVAMFLMLMLLLVVGPTIFGLSEGWSYYETVYFVWVSLSTIGYGDFVPHSGVGRLLGIIMIPFGLGVMVLVLTAISEFVENLHLYMDYNSESAAEIEKSAAMDTAEIESSGKMEAPAAEHDEVDTKCDVHSEPPPEHDDVESECDFQSEPPAHTECDPLLGDAK